ncbi:MAG TPA: spermidine/putrescine ABC transporter substrate-binding protein [Coleofasciculaceae cyanobacterium]
MRRFWVTVVPEFIFHSSIPPSQPAKAQSPGLDRRRLLQLSAGLVSGLALSGCGWRLAEVHSTEAAKGNPDQLFLYSWTSYIDAKLLEEFTAQTGIQAKTDIYNSNEMMLATFQAGKGGIYSIIYPSDYAVAQMIDTGLLSELDRSRINGLENILPNFQDSVYDPGNRHSVPISWGTTGIVYNQEKIDPPPTDWNYLWQHKEKLSRRITLLDDMREVMGATLRSLGYSYNSTNPREIEKAYAALAELKPTLASFTSDAWRDQLLAGDLWLVMGYSSDAVAVINEDSRINYVIPQSGTSLWSDTMVIPKTAPNPNAAYAWINYMLQPAVAAQVAERLFFATPNQAAFDQLPLRLQQNTRMFPPPEVLVNSERIEPLERSILEIYERYWTKLTSG